MILDPTLRVGVLPLSSASLHSSRFRLYLFFFSLLPLNLLRVAVLLFVEGGHRRVSLPPSPLLSSLYAP
jgi:hypothetical protein